MKFRRKDNKREKMKDGPLRKSRDAAKGEGITHTEKGQRDFRKLVLVRDRNGKRYPCVKRTSGGECLSLVKAHV